MRKFLLLVAAVAATGLVGVAAADAATSRGIDPVYVSGNPDCKDLVAPPVTSAIQAKFDLPANGATDGRVHITLTANGNSTLPPTVGWYVLNNEDVDAVIVKGGSGANVYRYPVGGDFSDGLMTTPLNTKNGKPAALGYVTVCYTP